MNLEYIGVDIPPPSPNPLFNEDEYFAVSHVTSPTKRAVTNWPAMRKRRKCTQRTVPPQEPLPDPPFSIVNPQAVAEPSFEGPLIVDVDGYDAYAKAVDEHCTGFYALSGKLYVVQGWNPEYHCVKNTWYHLHRVVSGDNVHLSCTCPSGRNLMPSSCVHEWYIHKSYHRKAFLREQPKEQPVSLFSRQTVTEDRTHQNWFSVLNQQMNTSSHIIVVFEGDDAGNGSWQCMKDRGSKCSHVTAASEEFKRLLQVVGSDFDFRLNYEHPTILNTPSYDISVSHRKILPPTWCLLPSDPKLYERCPPIFESPGVIKLNNDARCVCGAQYSPSSRVSRDGCTIYSLARAFTTKIELQSCPSCPSRGRKFIGPDAREIGLFNLDNKRLFSYDLLDKYTSAFTSSKTPFVAWVSSRAHTYTTYKSVRPFVSENVFRTAWFAYIQLQHFEDDMACKICGPTPERVIWDGVTIAFRKEKLLPSLQPPTSTSDDSPIRDSIRYQPKQQLILDRDVRQILRRFLQYYEGCRSNGETGGGETDLDASTVKEKLRGVDSGLAALFANQFSTMYCDPTFIQLFYQIASDDTALRLATKDDIELLKAFLAETSPFDASRLITIPSIYLVLQSEHLQHQCYRKTIIQAVQWILDRLEEVLNNLIVLGAPLQPGLDKGVDDWRRTGAIYNLPRVRERPKYPRLRHEQEQESGKRGGKCSKYYAQYSQQNLTGGIMGVWCMHVVCYGFHCIPRSEGRNDVFSAMVTRWPKAPKVIVYDFACALGPYCLLREPDFFANTKFLIDQFHSSNHTKCDRAWFLSTYAATDPRLASLNSSAAECGNSGLNRIRKSISYMSQGRSIAYARVFLAV